MTPSTREAHGDTGRPAVPMLHPLCTFPADTLPDNSATTHPWPGGEPESPACLRAGRRVHLCLSPMDGDFLATVDFSSFARGSSPRRGLLLAQNCHLSAAITSHSFRLSHRPETPAGPADPAVAAWLNPPHPGENSALVISKKSGYMPEIPLWALHQFFASPKGIKHSKAAPPHTQGDQPIFGLCKRGGERAVRVSDRQLVEACADAECRHLDSAPPHAREDPHTGSSHSWRCHDIRPELRLSEMSLQHCAARWRGGDRSRAARLA